MRNVKIPTEGSKDQLVNLDAIAQMFWTDKGLEVHWISRQVSLWTGPEAIELYNQFKKVAT
jgi:hypothetical protein